MKVGEMGGACSMHGTDEKYCIYRIVEHLREEIT
jgi:hypothetical protein